MTSNPPGADDPNQPPNPFSREGAPPEAAPSWPQYSGAEEIDGPGRGPEETQQSFGGHPYPADPYSTGPYGADPYGSSYAGPYGADSSGPYAVNAYQPSYGGSLPYGVVPRQHPQATIALVLGILGVAMCPLAGIGGLVLGIKARKEIDAQPYAYTGRGMAAAGFVMGIISVVYIALGVIFVIMGVGGAFNG
jgi:hypothetical protein